MSARCEGFARSFQRPAGGLGVFARWTVGSTEKRPHQRSSGAEASPTGEWEARQGRVVFVTGGFAFGGIWCGQKWEGVGSLGVDLFRLEYEVMPLDGSHTHVKHHGFSSPDTSSRTFRAHLALGVCKVKASCSHTERHALPSRLGRHRSELSP